jgi:hypothetical protein
MLIFVLMTYDPEGTAKLKIVAAPVVGSSEGHEEEFEFKHATE